MSEPTKMLCLASCTVDQRFAVGQMAAGVVVWLVNPYLVYEEVNWRMMLLLSAAPVSVVGPIAYLRLPESPMWLFVSAENVTTTAPWH